MIYQEDIIEDLSNLANKKIKILSNIDYILGNQGEFEFKEASSVAKLNKSASTLRIGLNKLRDHAKECYRDYDKCKLPEEIEFPDIVLPTRISEVDAPCKNPTYVSTRHPICGIESYNTARGAQCGVELYASASGPACGIERNNLRRGQVCGVDKYKNNENIKCGFDDPRVTKSGVFCRFDRSGRVSFSVECEIYSRNKKTYKRWKFAASRLNDGDAADRICRKMGSQYIPVNWRMGRNSDRFKPIVNRDSFTGQTRMFGCFKPKKCRLSEHGVETYKFCRHPSFGVDSYKTCRHPSFGIQRYKECEDKAFGVNKYKICSRPEFGIKQCND